MVTAVEVYSRDVLDGILRICSPDFFVPHLKRIHTKKYDIAELVEFSRKGIHPLELIAANQSFQNVNSIDSVFSKFLGNSIWKELFDFRIRFTDDPLKTEHTFEETLVADLDRLFNLRHELVHDPKVSVDFDAETETLIVSAAYVVFGVDFILMNMIANNECPHKKKSNAV